MAHENHFDRAAESKPTPLKSAFLDGLAAAAGLKPGAYISGVILIQCCG
jgi:hypothetical protein